MIVLCSQWRTRSTYSSILRCHGNLYQTLSESLMWSEWCIVQPLPQALYGSLRACGYMQGDETA